MTLLSRRSAFCLGYVLILTVLWLALTLQYWRGEYRHLMRGVGSLIGVVGLCCLSLSLILASRARFLEKWLGGLDQIYAAHKWVGITGFCFVIIHPLVFGLRHLPHHIDKFLFMVLPLHHRLSVDLGAYAFWVLCVILIITLLKVMAYHRWKDLHKLMSAIFILVCLHVLLSNHLFGPYIPTLVILCIPMGLGLVSIVYKQLMLNTFIKPTPYRVTDVAPLNSRTLRATLQPVAAPLESSSGQYGFFSFCSKHLSRESHPFTLCSGSVCSTLSIVVKARGDFTKKLYNTLAVGDTTHIEGPYGRFDYTKGKARQVWIAGGIGVVPFLSWMESIDSSIEIDLYYATHSREEGVGLEVFEHMSQTFDNFHFYYYCSEENTRLTGEQIKKHSPHLEKSTVMMCGPKRMTKDLTRQLTHLGVKRSDIVFEEFEFY